MTAIVEKSPQLTQRTRVVRILRDRTTHQVFPQQGADDGMPTDDSKVNGKARPGCASRTWVHLDGLGSDAGEIRENGSTCQDGGQRAWHTSQNLRYTSARTGRPPQTHQSPDRASHGDHERFPIASSPWHHRKVMITVKKRLIKRSVGIKNSGRNGPEGQFMTASTTMCNAGSPP